MKRWLLPLCAALACGPLPFDPQSSIEGVRVLASRTETPYALPGEDIDVELLVVDGRRERPRPLVVGWLPLLCINPAADLYLACFSPDTRVQLASGVIGSASPPTGGQGLDIGALAGTDITGLLTPGPRFSFTMPDDAIIKHPNGRDYGLVVLFNIACAGRVRIAKLDPAAGQQQMPLECVDDAGNVLGANDYVVGFTRVYAYTDRRNQNPQITGVTFEGKPIDLSVGVEVPTCTKKLRTECESYDFDVLSNPDAQERKLGETPQNGEVSREQVYAQLYTTTGLFSPEALLLFDAVTGAVDDRRASFIPPAQPAEGRIYVVLKDDRGGTSWVDFPVRVK